MRKCGIHSIFFLAYIIDFFLVFGVAVDLKDDLLHLTEWGLSHQNVFDSSFPHPPHDPPPPIPPLSFFALA